MRYFTLGGGVALRLYPFNGRLLRACCTLVARRLHAACAPLACLLRVDAAPAGVYLPATPCARPRFGVQWQVIDDVIARIGGLAQLT